MIDWNKYKSSENESSKKAFIDFCNKLNEINAQLIGDYAGAKEVTEIKIDENCIITTPDTFKGKLYKSVSKFFLNLKKEGDHFIKFSNINESNVLIAKIETFDGAIIEISINLYNTFARARKGYYDFFSKLNYKHTAYAGGDKRISVFLEGNYKMDTTPENFKYFTNKSIQNFKKQLSKNGDELISFIGVDEKNRLLSKIKTFDNGVAEVPVMSYSKFVQARNRFFKMASEINAVITSPYISDRENITAKFNSVEVKVTPNNFKKQNYTYIKLLMEQLELNGDKFIEFSNVTKNNNLIATICTIDNGVIKINTANYKTFADGRQRTFDYAKENNITIETPYIGAHDNLIINFGCNHGSYTTTPHNLKRSYGECPFCFSSKGEEEIAKVLSSLRYEFDRQKRFPECRRENMLPFDFYIESLNLCIEFDGIQHYEPVDFSNKGEEHAFKEFKIRQINDKIKNEFCKKNKIKLIRIPYYDYDNISDILNDLK